MPEAAFEIEPFYGTLRLFGRPQAQAGAAVIPVPEKGFGLLALLAMSPNFEIDRREAKAALWGDLPQERQSGNLRQLLLRMSKLVDAVGSFVISHGEILRLGVPSWKVDVVDLLSAEALPDDMADYGSWLAPGQLLEGFGAQSSAFEEWLSEARVQVADKRTRLVADSLACATRTMPPDDRIRLAELLIGSDPTNGLGHQALMTAHVGAGRMHLARRAWSDCRAVMKADSDATPDAETFATAAKLGLAISSVQTQRAIATPRKDVGAPRVIMMPPVGLGDEPLYERLGLALIEDVTIGLSQYRSFRIIAAHTSFALARLGAQAEAGADTQFDYEVTMSIRGRAGDLVASCRLTRVSDSEVIWAIQFPIDTNDLRTSLDVVVRKTVVTLADAVDRAESLTSIDDNDPTGYRLYLEGRRAIGGTRLESLRQARRWFRAAVKRCDSFSSAFAGLSRSYSMEWLVRGMTNGELLDESLTMANRARECDPGSGRPLRELGFVSLYRKRHAESLDRFGEARSLMPNDGDLLADYADALLHDGQADEALGIMTQARQVNPLPPDYYRWIDASIHYQLENYDEAVRILDPVSAVAATSRLMAASCAMAGRQSEAQRYAAIVRENYPDFKVDQVWQIVPDRRPQDTRQLIQGLALAGLN